MAADKIPSSNELAADRTQLADKRTSLAIVRTMAALDRTLMAWVRTAVSMISFGFTIYKFFEFLKSDSSLSQAERLTVLSPRAVGLVMITLGVIALALATVDYRRQVRELRKAYHQYGPFHASIAAAVAAVVSGLGLIGFILVLLRQ